MVAPFLLVLQRNWFENEAAPVSCRDFLRDVPWCRCGLVLDTFLTDLIGARTVLRFGWTSCGICSYSSVEDQSFLLYDVHVCMIDFCLARNLV